MTPRGRWHRLPRDPSTTRQVRTWARAMLTPGAAAVLDTETTGLGDDARIVDIGVVDAATGIVLLSTLVNPGQPIPAEATAIHHIADADVVDAPSWGQVLSDLEATLGFREIVAYHAAFDRARVVGECAAHLRRSAELLRPDRWHCLLEARSKWLSTTRRLPLTGPHRAAGDALAARDLLVHMSRGRGAQLMSHRMIGVLWTAVTRVDLSGDQHGNLGLDNPRPGPTPPRGVPGEARV